MDLLQILTNLLNGNNISPAFKEVFSLLQQNSFDIKRTISSLTPKSLIAIFGELMKNAQKNPPNQPVGGNYGLSPIAEIADKDVVYTLNKYFSSF